MCFVTFSDMDIISTLPDDLLVKILLLVPTKDAVSTSILSKRWEHLWMLLPKLVYGRRHCSGPECRRLRSTFIDRNLPLHRAPVIESFRLELWCWCFERENISMWVSTAVSQCVIRELEILDKFYPPKPNILPSNLYTCKSLVILKLNGDIILDVPGMVSLPSLKALTLRGVRYSNEDTLPRLLSNCPILEDLVVKLRWYNEGKFIVVARSLPRLTLVIAYNNNMDGYVIETPSLKYLKLKDHNDKSHYCLIEDMPVLVEAYVDVMIPDIKSIVGSLKYVKRLGICSETMLGEGFVFNQLEHLDVCLCEKHSPYQLAQLLKNSPNLQVLHLFYMKHHEPLGMDDWNQPTTVPECLLSSLQRLSWLEYTGEPQEREIAVYILKQALHLKSATIKSSESAVLKLEMLKELALSSGASAACKLMFQ